MNTRFFRVVSLLAILLILLAAVGCRQGVEIGELQTKSETIELSDAGSVQVEIDLAAGDLIRECAQVVDGGGGGRPDFAQAGGKDPAKIDAAIERFYALTSDA